MTFSLDPKLGQNLRVILGQNLRVILGKNLHIKMSVLSKFAVQHFSETTLEIVFLWDLKQQNMQTQKTLLRFLKTGFSNRTPLLQLMAWTNMFF